MQVKRQYGKDESQALPRSVFRRRNNYKDDRELDDDIAAGEVQSWEVDGQQFCAVRAVTIGKSHEVRDNQSMTVGKDITLAQAKEIEAAVQKFKFGINYTSKEQKAILDAPGTVPAKCISKIGGALVLLEKQEKQASQLFVNKQHSGGQSSAKMQFLASFEEILTRVGEAKMNLTSMYRFKKDSTGAPLDTDKAQKALQRAAVDLDELGTVMKAAKGF